MTAAGITEKEIDYVLRGVSAVIHIQQVSACTSDIYALIDHLLIDVLKFTSSGSIVFGSGRTASAFFS